MSPDVRNGMLLGGFRIREIVGSGAMGTVYLAEDAATGELVALKVLAPELARDERFRKRFLRESRLAASIEHPNAAVTLAAGETDGLLYLAMRYVPGSDLRDILRREGMLEPQRAVRLISQVAAALDEAHRVGLIHRDVKPGNILVAAEGDDEQAYVCDFGLARHVSSVSSLTGERGFVGTIDYVPPEQIEGGKIDARADVYSLGCVLFECLTGTRPFDRDSELSVVFAHLNEPPPAPAELRPELPQAFDQVIATALAKSPAERYASCGELAAAGRAALHGKAMGRRRPRRQLAAAAIAVGVIAAIVGGVLAAGGGGRPAHEAKPLALVPNAVSFVSSDGGRVVGRVRLAPRSDYGIQPSDLVFAGGAAWVLLPGQQRLARIDPTTRKMTRSVALPWPPGSRISAGDGLVWAAEEGGAHVLGVDGRTGRIVRRLSVSGSNADGLAFGGNALWVAQGSDVARVDPRTGRVLLRVHNAGQDSATVWLEYADGAVWSARASVGIVRKIDPVSGQIVATAHLDGWISDLAVGDGFVWASKLPDGFAYRLSEDSLDVLGTVQTGPDPERIALAGRALWVANGTGRAVSRVDLDSLARRQFAASAEPTVVRAKEGLLWTGARPSPQPLPPIDGPELRIAADYSPSADPVLSHDLIDEQRMYATCANLLAYPDAAGARGARLVPEVAAAMPVVSMGGRRYTFRVRPGFRFSPPSNEPVTAATFRHTVERAMSPKYGSTGSGPQLFSDLVGAAAYLKGMARHVSGIVVRGNTISYTLTRPHGDFPTRLSSAGACPVPMRQPVEPQDIGLVPSAGPYYVASIEGDRAVLLRNPNYHGPRPRRPERIVYTDDVQAPEAVALADAGAVDYVPKNDDPLLPGGAVDRRYGPASAAARAGRERYFLEPMPWVDGLLLNAARPLFAELRLRRAVNYALDRRALAKAFFDDPTDELVPRAVVGFRAGAVYPLSPDLGIARRLAGRRSRHAVLWYCTNGLFGSPTQRVVAQLIRAELARIRIGVSIVRSDCDPNSRYDRTSRSADILMFSAGSPLRDAGEFLHAALAGGQYGGILGQGPWDAASFRRRLAEAATLRGGARTRAYVRVVHELMRAAPYAIYGSYVSAEYFSPKAGCRVLQPALGFVDLGALCVPRGPRPRSSS